MLGALEYQVHPGAEHRVDGGGPGHPELLKNVELDTIILKNV